MGRARSGALLGLTAGCVLVALGAANCADATEIIVEVRADPALCSNPMGIETGIAVSTPDRIDDEELEIFQSGCTGDQMIGRLTITPSGSKDARVGIRIVAGVGVRAGECHGPKWEHCILARRTIEFASRQANYIAVYLSAACIGKGCGEKECDRGACVDPDAIPTDGGHSEPTDAAHDGGADEDASNDGGDACARCEGSGMTCDGKTCTVDCNVVDCQGTVVCPPEIDCTYQCTKNGSCFRTQCGGSTGACTFECSATGACSDISCSREKCVVDCSTSTSACIGVDLDGGSNTVRCKAAAIGLVGPTCDNVDCSGTTCERTCGGLNRTACGTGGECSPQSDCTDWMDGG